jgi:hypothetical protein
MATCADLGARQPISFRVNLLTGGFLMRRITIGLLAAVTVGISAAAGWALPLTGSESILGFATDAHTGRMLLFDLDEFRTYEFVGDDGRPLVLPH